MPFLCQLLSFSLPLFPLNPCTARAGKFTALATSNSKLPLNTSSNSLPPPSPDLSPSLEKKNYSALTFYKRTCGHSHEGKTKNTTNSKKITGLVPSAVVILYGPHAGIFPTTAPCRLHLFGGGSTLGPSLSLHIKAFGEDLCLRDLKVALKKPFVIPQYFLSLTLLATLMWAHIARTHTNASHDDGGGLACCRT